MYIEICRTVCKISSIVKNSIANYSRKNAHFEKKMHEVVFQSNVYQTVTK